MTKEPYLSITTNAKGLKKRHVLIETDIPGVIRNVLLLGNEAKILSKPQVFPFRAEIPLKYVHLMHGSRPWIRVRMPIDEEYLPKESK